jgi:hypothetical protein
MRIAQEVASSGYNGACRKLVRKYPGRCPLAQHTVAGDHVESLAVVSTNGSFPKGNAANIQHMLEDVFFGGLT